MKRITAFSLAAALLLGTTSMATPAQAALPFSFFSSPEAQTSTAGGEQKPSLAPMLKKVTPAVVNISTTGKVKLVTNPLLNDPLFKQFFNIPERQQQPQERTTQSVGSGVIVDAQKGYVLTNNHVVRDADEIYVTLKDKRRIKAKLIGTDKETDIAVLQIKADNLSALTIGDDDSLEVGDMVIAIGNPFGLGQTVTSGIISALDRNGLGIEGYESFIQTDAAINPGNSGGALVNHKGELIGINTAILSQSGGNVGIGFAIPVDMAGQVMKQLIEHGSVERGRLGIHIQDLTPEIADVMNINVNQGAVVAQVDKDSAADKAGIKEGDVVVKFNNTDVSNASDLKNKVGMLRIGQEVPISVLREGKTVEVKATIVKAITVAAKEGGTVVVNKNDIPLLKGVSLASIPQDSTQYGKVTGAYVARVEPGSVGAASGLRAGDIITSVNQQKVKTLDEAITALKKHPKGLLLNVVRGNGALFVVIK